MDYNEFCEWVKARIGELYEEKEAQVEICSMQKNNGVRQDGIFIKEKGTNMVPAIYLADYYTMYENGMDTEELICKIAALYEENKKEGEVDFSFFGDFESVKGNIAFKLINKEANRELLKEIPWMEVLDLALVFYCILPESFFVSGTVLIRNKYCEDWGIDTKTLYETAKENTSRICPPLLLDMKDMLYNLQQRKDAEQEGFYEMLWKPLDMEEMDFSNRQREECMLVLTNHRKNEGAAAILYDGILAKISEAFQSDLFILPSSVHECILLPAGEGHEKEELEALVHTVNETQVAREERLSDRVYCYSREQDGIS